MLSNKGYFVSKMFLSYCEKKCLCILQNNKWFKIMKIKPLNHPRQTPNFQKALSKSKFCCALITLKVTFAISTYWRGFKWRLIWTTYIWAAHMDMKTHLAHTISFFNPIYKSLYPADCTLHFTCIQSNLSKVSELSYIL